MMKCVNAGWNRIDSIGTSVFIAHNLFVTLYIRNDCRHSLVCFFSSLCCSLCVYLIARLVSICFVSLLLQYHYPVCKCMSIVSIYWFGKTMESVRMRISVQIYIARKDNNTNRLMYMCDFSFSVLSILAFLLTNPYRAVSVHWNWWKISSYKLGK